MDRQAVRSLVLALVGMTAVSLAAVSLESPVAVESDASTGIGGTEGGFIPTPEPVNATGSGFQLHVPPEVGAVLGIVLLVGALAYAVVYWRETLVWVLTAAAFLLAGYLLLRFLQGIDLPDLTGPGGGGLLGDAGAGLVASSQSTPSTVPTVLLLGIALIGAVIVLAGLTGSRESEDGGGSEASSPEVAAIGRAAGRRADRIASSAPVDNEVYRAWKEMTDLLSVPDPETSTPGEFAAAAVDAGMDEADVRELTGLFEDVRYGTADPTAEDERRALSVFRRIESRYGDGP